ncbi:hypothetical protein AX16_000863 [Volvariella volvacea WC 439]|nr:hypothetical protein AX16_000863 [Volvariella volvacea WC 439]
MAKAQTSPTEHWDCHDLNWQNLPPIKNEHAWKELNEWSHKYDVEMCKGWSEEIENLLIFTGLFGATVTAFAVEAFQWLQEDPNERNSIFLAQISLQIANLTNPGLLAGSSIPIIDPIVTSAEPFDVEGYILRVNVLWMLSLTLSLSTVLIGILCMQWLREFLKDSSLSPKDNLPIRYLRFQGLNAWKVPQIVSSLPLLLQISVILFFAGFIDLLWHLHTTVAIFVIVLVTLVLTFVLFTTISPASQVLLLNCTPEDARFSQCPYKSPQSWLVVRLLQILRNTFRKLDEWLSIPLFTSLFLLPMLPLTLNYLPSPPKRLTLKRIAQHLSNLCRKVWHLKLGGTSRSWVELEISWHRNSYNQAISDAANGIVWLSQTYQQNQVVDCLVNCLPTLSYWVLSQLIIALGYPTIVDEFEAHLASLPADELWGPNWNSYSSGCTVLSIHIIDRLAGTSLKYRTLIHELTIRCINSMPRETINFLRPAQYQDIFNRCFRVDPSDNDKDQFHEKIRLPSFLSFADRLCQDRDELWQPLAQHVFLRLRLGDGRISGAGRGDAPGDPSFRNARRYFGCFGAVLTGSVPSAQAGFEEYLGKGVGV